MPAKHSACNKAFSDGGVFFFQKTEWKEKNGSYLAKGPLYKQKKLVGGFNPFEKYIRQNGNLHQI